MLCTDHGHFIEFDGYK